MQRFRTELDQINNVQVFHDNSLACDRKEMVTDEFATSNQNHFENHNVTDARESANVALTCAAPDNDICIETNEELQNAQISLDGMRSSRKDAHKNNYNNW